MVSRPSGDGPPTNRLTIPDAASVLGLTSEAVRGRVKRGTLPSERDAGGTVYVLLEADRPTDDRAATDHQPTVDPPRDQSELVEALRSEVEYLRGQLDQEREAGRRKDHLLAAALERMPELGAGEHGEERSQGPPPPMSSEGVEESGEATTAPKESSQRRSWWRRIFGG